MEQNYKTPKLHSAPLKHCSNRVAITHAGSEGIGRRWVPLGHSVIISVISEKPGDIEENKTVLKETTNWSENV